MMDEEFERLFIEASKLSGKRVLNEDFRYKQVGCALLTREGNIYTGVSLKAVSSTGFCAEQAAVAEMLKYDEYVIKKIVAVQNGKVVSPCGKCREFLKGITPENLHTQVLLDHNIVVTLEELLPYAFVPNKLDS